MGQAFQFSEPRLQLKWAEFAPPARCTELVVMRVVDAADGVLAGAGAGVAASFAFGAAGCVAAAAAAAAAGAAVLVDGFDAGATLGVVVQPRAACLQHQFC